MKTIILASGSQGRKMILEKAGIPFKAIPVDADESLITNRSYAPAVLVEKLALLKAEYAMDLIKENGVVITADTIVALKDEILLKPKDLQDAYNTIAKLSGTTHQVYSGVCIYEKNKAGFSDKISFSECTEIKMRTLSSKEIQQYVDSGDPMGKAGSLDIQGRGSVFIEKINGDYLNVVGLPLCRVYKILLNMDAV